MKAAILFLTAALTAQGALAFNYQFLKHSPAAAFTEADWEIATRTVNEALNAAPDGETYEWENPETGNSGSYQVKPAPEGRASECRSLTSTHRSKAATATTDFVLCPEDDGSWRLPR
jgi:surface antigen